MNKNTELTTLERLNKIEQKVNSIYISILQKKENERKRIEGVIKPQKS